MNLGAIIVLLKFLQDAGVGQKVSPIGPPVPQDADIPTNVSIKPLCGPGRYAQFNFTTGLWSCLVIPKGR
jgi:hypothetical protein